MAQSPHTLSLRHEISLYGTFGGSSLPGHYTGNVSPSEVFGKFGSGGGVGYTFFFHPQWGVTTGAEAAFFNATVQSAKLTGSTLETYSYGAATEPMYFNSVLENYEETQRVTYIHVPLLLQFQTAGRHKFFMAVGGKVGFALSGNYEATAANLTTSGYLPESAQTFTNMPNHGFTTIQKPASTGAIDFGLNVSAAAEMGVRWAMGKRVALYTGVYLDYGLLDVAPEKTAGLVNYQAATPREFIYNSILTAQQSPTGEVYVDKVNLFSAGIKVRLAVGW
ncbi:MAG: PorT family protein [Prevotellaceae bacterium]|nr:PorT family protein [Prevotellaceae bacterium]